MTEKRYGMVIDTQHCVGCQTCTVSCKISNEVPGSAHWNHLESLDGDVLYQSTARSRAPRWPSGRCCATTARTQRA